MVGQVSWWIQLQSGRWHAGSRLRGVVITVAGWGKFGTSPSSVIAALRSLRLASVASRATASLGKLYPQAMAHSDQAAVLRSMIAPSNLCDHVLPNNSFKR